MRKKIPFYVITIAVLVWIFSVLPKDTKIKNVVDSDSLANNKVEKMEGKYSLKIKDLDISLLVSDTEETRTKGLSEIDALPEGSAMLFVFDKPDTYGFWMKDMKFPIDVIWLDEKMKITHIEKNVSPDTFPNKFFPPEKSLYVIEFNAGFSEQNGLAVGNILDLKKR